MNRTQYEAIHGPSTKKPCALCNRNRDLRNRVTKYRRMEREQLAAAKKAGIQSGSVIELFGQDEFTGWHYNLRTGQLTGKGQQ